MGGQGDGRPLPKMSKLGVRNIDGFNARVKEAEKKAR
jgi:DNA segregation ATPase FtsK/SpoIIIE-like protein